MKNRHGFTLLELLIVVIIIGVLASLAIPQFAAAVDRSRETEALNVLSAIGTAEMVQFQENATFVNTTAGMTTLTLPGVLHDWAAPTYVAGSAVALDGVAAGGALTTGVAVYIDSLGVAPHNHGVALGGAAAALGSHGLRVSVVSTGAKRVERHRPADAAGLWTAI